MISYKVIDRLNNSQFVVLCFDLEAAIGILHNINPYMHV